MGLRPPIAERHAAILFDMNQTIMFEGDRFGPREDFHATYRSVGGSRLSREELTRCVSDSLNGFFADYANPALVDDFPSLRETIRKYSVTSEDELPFVERVVAAHEVGVVPCWASETINALAETTRLGLVSNVFAPSHFWAAELERAGVASAFECRVFSSDIRSVKPSGRPFREALQALDLLPEDVLFVGDSLERDIAPAKALGMSTCWVTPRKGGTEHADFCIPSIAALLARRN